MAVTEEGAIYQEPSVGIMGCHTWISIVRNPSCSKRKDYRSDSLFKQLGNKIFSVLMQSRPRTIDEMFPLMQDNIADNDGVCVHKDLFSPFLTMDVVGTFVLIVIMALATKGRYRRWRCRRSTHLVASVL